MKTKLWLIFSIILSMCIGLGYQSEAVQAKALPAQAAMPKACISGPHSGEISTDQTWCAADNPHILSASVTVNSGITLTIEPGVIVKGSANSELKILGHLSAIGNAEQPILFTSTANSGPVEWGGLAFLGGTGNMQYTTVRYGGDDSNSVHRGDVSISNVANGEVLIQNSQIKDVSYNFYLQTVDCVFISNSHVTIDNTTFSGCASASGYYDLNYPIYISGAASQVTLTNNTFTNNFRNRIALEIDAMMGQDATLWPQTIEGKYELLNRNASFVVPASVTLSVQPGVTVMSSSNNDFKILGRLESHGTAEQPVTFTSISDSGAEQWPGIYIDGGSGLLQNTIIRYAGLSNSGGWMAGLTVNNALEDAVIIENSTIINNLNSYYQTTSHGMLINNSHVQITNSLFANNGKPSGGYYGRDYAVYISGPDSVVELSGNTFSGNSRDKIGLAPAAMSAQTTLTLVPQAIHGGYEFDGSYTIPTGTSMVVLPGTAISARTQTDELLVYGHLEAIGTENHPILFTSGGNSGPQQWAGIVFKGGSGHLSHIIARYGGGKSSLNTYGTINALDVATDGLTIDHSLITQGYYFGLQLYNSVATVTDSRFTANGIDPRYDMAIYANLSQVQLNSNIFSNNARDLVLIGVSSATLTNNVFSGGWSNGYQGYNHAVIVYNGASAILKHNTFANLRASGVYVTDGGWAQLNNSIFAQNSTGIIVESGGTANLSQTLWDRNGVDISGSASATGSISGPAGFAPDGYHLTRYSMALERGVADSVSVDIDGQARPLPNGTAPDLGADEYPYTLGKDFATEQFALAPQWVVLPDPITGNPSGMLRQSYFIRYFYGSPEANPPALNIEVSDTLPDELAFEKQQTNPPMDFSVLGQTLHWQSQLPLEKDHSGEIILSGLYNQPIPGETLTNNATLNAGPWHFDLQASSQVPLFPPMITTPGDGEICTGPGNSVSLTVKGAAQNSAIIKFYENTSFVGQTTATTDGLFTYTYTSSVVGVSTLTLSARACLPSNPDTCSAPDEVTLTPQRSFWDPQLSYWEFFPSSGPSVISRFRRDGLFSTQNAIMPRQGGFSSSTLHLYICTEVDDTWIVVNDTRINPTTPKNISGKRSWYGETAYNVGTAVYNPCSWLNATRNLDTWMDSECALTDPDGYVFDITQGFDPAIPTNTVIEGSTVTCMMYQPQWGGWVPWPAQLYDHQVNPQITSADGHFAFFTPPGQYYLQVDGPDGYQSYRSPIIEVASEVVHMNVPLTPLTNIGIAHITLSASGPVPAEITIPAGSAVEWLSELSGVLSPEELLPFILNPEIQALSEIDPQSNLQGWDSGMLLPGQTYTRRFTIPGTYTYTDGLGNSGQVIVEPYKTFLPAIQR